MRDVSVLRLPRRLIATLAGLALLLAAPSAAGQTQATLRIDPDRGPPGSTIELEGEGWRPTSPEDITVAWRNQDLEHRLEINDDGTLAGTADIPVDALGGSGVVEVCTLRSDGVDFDRVCADAGFTVTPVIKVTPTVGIPGTEISLTGAGFESTDPARQWEVRWTDGSPIGSAMVGPAGTLEGSGVIPLIAAEGLSAIQACQFDLDLGDVCHPAGDFEVVHPSVKIEPPEVLPQESFSVLGEGWCCDGDTGSVVESTTGGRWGTISVAGTGKLTGVATVPTDAEPGQVALAVCVSGLCREVLITVLSGSATTTPPTSSTTTGTDRPTSCAVRTDSLTVDPPSGESGMALLVTLTGADDSPPGCRVMLQLADEPIGEPFDLSAETESVVGATVPTGIAIGPAVLGAVDLADGRVLAAVTFDVKGGGFPRDLVVAGALVLILLALALTGWRRWAQRPSPTAADEPRTSAQVGPLVPVRWIEAHIFARHGGVENPVEYFRPVTSHRIEVRLGPSDAGYDQGLPQRLRVVLTEPHLLEAPHTAVVDLSDAGPSTSVSFMLTTTSDTKSVDARLLLVNGTRVVHTARLPTTVGPAPAAQPTDVAQIETVVRAPTLPPEGQGLTAAFVVDGGGAPGITQISSDRARRLQLSESGTDAVDLIRSRLGEVVETPEYFSGLDAEGTRKLLVFLAHHGRLLRSAIVDDSLGEQLAANPALQVVSAAPDAYLPLELAYDFVAPRLDAVVCPDAGDALRSADFAASCPGPHDESVVCPLGFWGMSKVIERHAFQPIDDLPSGFLVRAQPVGDRNRVSLATGVLVGASDRVNAHHPDTVEHLVGWVAAAAGSATSTDSWSAWEEEVASRSPAVLVLLPHTVYSDVLGTYGLEIGAADRLWAAQIDRRMVPDRPVVVALLGCETAVAGAVSYERFPGLLRRAGAEIVVATLTEVLGRHAAPVAERLVSLLHERCRTQPGRFGEVVVQLRRQLLAEGLPIVLALAVFGDADWVVGGA